MPTCQQSKATKSGHLSALLFPKVEDRNSTSWLYYKTAIPFTTRLEAGGHAPCTPGKGGARLLPSIILAGWGSGVAWITLRQ